MIISFIKLLSEACEYGLRAFVWMARYPNQPQKVKELAEQIRAAPGYLVKVLQELTRSGILPARRESQDVESRCRFMLNRPPSQITALDVINATDPLDREAHEGRLGVVHRQIDDMLATLEANFREFTIDDVVSSQPQSTLICTLHMPNSNQRATPSEPTYPRVQQP